jgi:hypothetical protein
LSALDDPEDGTPTGDDAAGGDGDGGGGGGRILLLMVIIGADTTDVDVAGVAPNALALAALDRFLASFCHSRSTSSSSCKIWNLMPAVPLVTLVDSVVDDDDGGAATGATERRTYMGD